MSEPQNQFDQSTAGYQKCLEYIDRKKNYNRKYYLERTRPKREQEKLQIEDLRKRCSELEG